MPLAVCPGRTFWTYFSVRGSKHFTTEARSGQTPTAPTFFGGVSKLAHRLRRSQPNARLRTPAVRSLHSKQRIAGDIKDPVAPHAASMHQRPTQALRGPALPI